ncbi:hypothetical protein FBALC1_00962 [Flavobacteriales bacterium ALC-1]|nr:hypothetical protein FBALC1_00962 [Flavobacteriales bacterium ALC-1]
MILIIGLGCKSQTSITRIEIVQPTLEHEATSIWRTINDIKFLESQGYKIHLPKDTLIDSLIIKSKNGDFGNDHYSSIYELLETKIFNRKDYNEAILKVNQQTTLINQLITEIDTSKNNWDWDFNMFNKYQVLLTLYGTGGSYDPEIGTIILLTDTEGKFKMYKNPANTIIHEITHMGMEYSLVKKFNLSHSLKERLVDTFVYLKFKDDLPQYRIQNMGDTSLDTYLKKKEDIVSLNAILIEFMKK